MQSRPDDFHERLSRLESTVRRQRLLLICAGGAIAAALALGLGAPAPGSGGAGERPGVVEEVRARRIVIVDERGVERMELAAPVIDPPGFNRIFRNEVGLMMRDEKGAERFGMGIMADGSVRMGFDAPPGVGSPMRDRIGLGVGSDGSASISLINNQTGIPVRLISEADGNGGVEFIDYRRDEEGVLTTALVRRVSFKDDVTTEHPLNQPAPQPRPDAEAVDRPQ